MFIHEPINMNDEDKIIEYASLSDAIYKGSAITLQTSSTSKLVNLYNMDETT